MWGANKFNEEAGQFAAEFFPALETASERPAPRGPYTSMLLAKRLGALVVAPTVVDGRVMWLRLQPGHQGGT